MYRREAEATVLKQDRNLVPVNSFQPLWKRLEEDSVPVTSGSWYLLGTEGYLRKWLDAGSPQDQERAFVACSEFVGRVAHARMLDAREALPQSTNPRSDRIVGGSKGEQELAAFLSRLVADRATADLKVGLLRELIYGKREPLSKEDAWDFIRRAKRFVPAAGRDDPRLETEPTNPFTSSPFVLEGNRLLTFRDDNGRDHTFVADEHSELNRLWVWATQFLITHRWPRSLGAWFLLTGTLPQVPPLTGIIHSSGKTLGAAIVITADLFATSDKSIMTMFKDAQRRVLGSHRGPLAFRRHAVVAFVDEQTRIEGKRPPWPILCERWDSEAPRQWRYGLGKNGRPRWRQMQNEDSTARDRRGA